MTDNENSGFIDPRNPINKIDDDVVLYAVNNSDSNIVLNDGTNTATLTTPGHPGSIQVITKDMLKSPGVMALWSTDRIRVSTSSDVGQRAVSSIQIQAEKEKAHKEEVNRIIEDSKAVAEGGAGEQTDESYKAKKLVDTGAVATPPVQDEPEAGTEEADEKPSTPRRRSKKTEKD